MNPHITAPILSASPTLVFKKFRITSLLFVNNYILVGEGNNLIFYSCDGKEVIQKTLRKNSVIHCLRTKYADTGGKIYIIAFGAKTFSIIVASCIETLSLGTCQTYEMDDWIWDVKWIDTKREVESQTIAIALAHNSIILWNCRMGTIIKRVQSTELSLLYSACLIGNTWNNIVLAAGTVFQEIIIWTPISRRGGKEGQVLHRLTGHQGVIFSIKYNEHTKLLCSTSDDRSVRIWRYTPPDEDWFNGSFSLLYTLFGHDSRVWQSEICAIKPFIISIGEDSNFCIWNTEDGSLIDSKNLSCGGLWSLAVNENESLIALGGGDGSVSIKDLTKKGFPLEEKSFPLPDECFSLPKSASKDFFRNIALLRKNDEMKVVVTTNNGLVLLKDISGSKWEKLYYDTSLAKYSVLSIWDATCDYCIAIGTHQGHVYLFTENFLPFKMENVHSGIIHSLLWSTIENIRYLMTSGPKGCVCLWKLGEEICESSVKLKFELELPMCKQRFPSAILLSPNGYCLLGDRMGGLHCYNIQLASTNFKPFCSLSGFHGKNGVTDICEIDNNLVLTSGRDGQVAFFKVNLSSGLDLLYSVKVPGSKLEWIGRILSCDRENMNLLLAGFHTTKFVLWSQKKQSNLIEISCGGGHRSWDVCLTNKKVPFIFTCIRQNRVLTFTSQENVESNSYVNIKPGFHTSKIWCGTLLFSSLIATGGEDNLIMISQIKSDSVGKRLTLAGHISIVRALSTTLLPEKNRCLLLSAGGQSQFIIWEIWLDASSGSIGHCRLATHFLKADQLPGDIKSGKAIADTHRMRYMDTIIKSANNLREYDVILAGSDSVVRFFSFALSSRKISFLSSLTVGQSCIFKLELIDDNLITGDGSGFLTVWDLKSKDICTKNLSLKLHEGGVNSLVAYKFIDNEWMICSGGDDNRIVVVTVVIHSNGTIKESRRICLDPHAAQISGLQLHMSRKGYPQKGYLHSVSIDQRLNVWNWEIVDSRDKFGSSEINMNLLSTTFSHVADAAGCILMDEPTKNETSERTILIYGCGVEVYSYNDS